MSSCPCLVLACGSAHPELGRVLARELGIELPAAVRLARFPDGELDVEISAEIEGRDVFLLQPTGAPIDANLIELAMLLDAARGAGAARVTALVPYFGYARQDRRGRAGAPLGLRVAADLLASAGAERIVAIDLHSAVLEACSKVPLVHLGAEAQLLQATKRFAGAEAVVVAPDLGAARRAERFAGALDLPVALVQKTRLSGSRVQAGPLIGDVRGRRPILVDDIVSTGGTIVAALEALAEQGAAAPAIAVATHGVLAAGARARLDAAGVERLIITDTLPVPPTWQDGHKGPGLESISVAPLLAAAVRRIHARPPFHTPHS